MFNNALFTYQFKATYYYASSSKQIHKLMSYGTSLTENPSVATRYAC